MIHMVDPSSTYLTSNSAMGVTQFVIHVVVQGHLVSMSEQFAQNTPAARRCKLLLWAWEMFKS